MPRTADRRHNLEPPDHLITSIGAMALIFGSPSQGPYANLLRS
jgi:hypothetical protein